jgi:hypothetical protein
MEIGSYFRDHGDIEESKKWTELSKHVGRWDRLPKGTRDDKGGASSSARSDLAGAKQ